MEPKPDAWTMQLKVESAQEEMLIEVAVPKFESDPLSSGQPEKRHRTRAVQKIRPPVKAETLRMTCGWCDESTEDTEEFVKHVSLHVPDILAVRDASYECKWTGCDFTTHQADESQRHVYYHAFHTRLKCIGSNMLTRLGLKGCSFAPEACNTLPELPEQLICYWDDCCEDRLPFLSAHHFYAHVQSHVEANPRGNRIEGGVYCKWDGCNANFVSVHKLKEHVRSHTQEKVVACPTCGGLFANRTKLYDHCKRQDPVTMQSFQCSHCSKTFALERLLRDHMRQHINNHKCPHCDMTCPQPSGLTTHIKFRHSSEKPFQCPHCPHTAKARSDLTRHMSTHLNTTEHQCEMDGCTYICRSMRTLAQHMLVKHKTQPPRYCCHMCNEVFPRGSRLTQHLIKKHKYQWPSGHSRFRYKCDHDGYLRLQTVRYESLELTEKLMEEGGSSMREEDPDEPASLVIAIEEIDDAGRVIRSEAVPQGLHVYMDNTP